jgi:hypothetical protein
MILALVAGIISWHLVEKPFLLRERMQRTYTGIEVLVRGLSRGT